ncbi:putative leucine-rich repeat-containing protein DDB_G0290503 [Onthophagus taurus]|uniref:putative leucine-rich repeat-containing protein DDB_G0290503 n=1 Tax=Onthophagus taurus TaxID=166361 RepID=UPI0039BE4628
MQYAGLQNVQGTSGTTHSNTLQYGQQQHSGGDGVISTNQQQQTAQSPPNNNTSTTSILRNYRKESNGLENKLQGNEPGSTSSGGEIQGPVARVAPHTYYPKQNGDGFRYQHFPDFGMQPQQIAPPPVKYSEIIEPPMVQGLDLNHHHLSSHMMSAKSSKEKAAPGVIGNVPGNLATNGSAAGSGASYLDMSCAKSSYDYNFGMRPMNNGGVYKQQFPLNAPPYHHPHHHPASNHHTLQMPPQVQHHQQYQNYTNKMAQYPRGSYQGNDFLSNLNKIAPDIAQDIINDQHLREQFPVYLSGENHYHHHRLYPNHQAGQSNRIYQRNHHHQQRNLNYNLNNLSSVQYQRNFQENYRLYQNHHVPNLRFPAAFEQIPQRGNYERPPFPPGFPNCSQIDYQNFHQSKIHFPPKNYLESNPEIPEIIPEVDDDDEENSQKDSNSGKSLKAYLENWNEESFLDDQENNAGDKENNTLYVLETMEIPSESVNQYIHLQPIEKLPPNVVISDAKQTGNAPACKLLQDIAINSRLKQRNFDQHPVLHIPEEVKTSKSLPILIQDDEGDLETNNTEIGDEKAKINELEDDRNEDNDKNEVENKFSVIKKNEAFVQNLKNVEMDQEMLSSKEIGENKVDYDKSKDDKLEQNDDGKNDNDQDFDEPNEDCLENKDFESEIETNLIEKTNFEVVEEKIVDEDEQKTPKNDLELIDNVETENNITEINEIVEEQKVLEVDSTEKVVELIKDVEINQKEEEKSDKEDLLKNGEENDQIGEKLCIQRRHIRITDPIRKHNLQNNQNSTLSNDNHQHSLLKLNDVDSDSLKLEDHKEIEKHVRFNLNDKEIIEKGEEKKSFSSSNESSDDSSDDESSSSDEENKNIEEIKINVNEDVKNDNVDEESLLSSENEDEIDDKLIEKRKLKENNKKNNKKRKNFCVKYPQNDDLYESRLHSTENKIVIRKMMTLKRENEDFKCYQTNNVPKIIIKNVEEKFDGEIDESQDFDLNSRNILEINNNNQNNYSVSVGETELINDFDKNKTENEGINEDNDKSDDNNVEENVSETINEKIDDLQSQFNDDVDENEEFKEKTKGIEENNEENLFKNNDIDEKPSENDQIDKELTKNDDEYKEIQGNPIENEDIQSNPIENEKIQSNPIEYEEIQSNPIENEEIQSNPIENEEIQSNPIENEEIQSNPIQNEEIESNPIEYEEIQSSPIENKEIQSNPIENEENLLKNDHLNEELPKSDELEENLNEIESKSLPINELEEKFCENVEEESVILEIFKELIEINVTKNGFGEKIIFVKPLSDVRVITNNHDDLKEPLSHDETLIDRDNQENNEIEEEILNIGDENQEIEDEYQEIKDKEEEIEEKQDEGGIQQDIKVKYQEIGEELSMIEGNCDEIIENVDFIDYNNEVLIENNQEIDEESVDENSRLVSDEVIVESFEIGNQLIESVEETIENEIEGNKLIDTEVIDNNLIIIDQNVNKNYVNDENIPPPELLPENEKGEGNVIVEESFINKNKENLVAESVEDDEEKMPILEPMVVNVNREIDKNVQDSIKDVVDTKMLGKKRKFKVKLMLDGKNNNKRKENVKRKLSECKIKKKNFIKAKRKRNNLRNEREFISNSTQKFAKKEDLKQKMHKYKIPKKPVNIEHEKFVEEGKQKKFKRIKQLEEINETKNENEEEKSVIKLNSAINVLKKKVQFDLSVEKINPNLKNDLIEPNLKNNFTPNIKTKSIKSCLKGSEEMKKRFLDPLKRSYSLNMSSNCEKKRRLSLEEYNKIRKKNIINENFDTYTNDFYRTKTIDLDFESAKMQEEIEKAVLKNLSSPNLHRKNDDFFNDVVNDDVINCGDDKEDKNDQTYQNDSSLNQSIIINGNNFDSDDDEIKSEVKTCSTKINFVDKSIVEEKINSLEEFLPKISRSSNRSTTSEEISQKIDDLFSNRPIYEQRNYRINRFLQPKLTHNLTKRYEAITVNIDFDDFNYNLNNQVNIVNNLIESDEEKMFNEESLFRNPERPTLYDEDDEKVIKMSPKVDKNEPFFNERMKIHQIIDISGLGVRNETSYDLNDQKSIMENVSDFENTIEISNGEVDSIKVDENDEDGEEHSPKIIEIKENCDDHHRFNEEIATEGDLITEKDKNHDFQDSFDEIKPKINEEDESKKKNVINLSKLNALMQIYKKILINNENSATPDSYKNQNSLEKIKLLINRITRGNFDQILKAFDKNINNNINESQIEQKSCYDIDNNLEKLNINTKKVIKSRKRKRFRNLNDPEEEINTNFLSDSSHLTLLEKRCKYDDYSIVNGAGSDGDVSKLVIKLKKNGVENGDFGKVKNRGPFVRLTRMDVLERMVKRNQRTIILKVR